MQGLNHSPCYIPLVQMVQGLKLYKGSNVSRVQTVKEWFKNSKGSMVQVVQGFKEYKGSNGPRVQMVQGIKWLKGLIGPWVQ